MVGRSGMVSTEDTGHRQRCGRATLQEVQKQDWQGRAATLEESGVAQVAVFDYVLG